MTDSGHEMGSLGVERATANLVPEGFAREELALNDVEVTSVKIGTAFEGGVTSECGISLSDRNGDDWTILTAPATGAVAIILPGNAPPPATEFLLSSIDWRSLSCS